jgi:hypothetical protein
MALAPRGGGGMSGAPGAIVTQDRSGADLGAGLAGLGERAVGYRGDAGPAMTSLQKDFGFARKDGYKGSFTDFVRETRSTAIERAPQGYERTPDGMRPIAGGPADPATIAATEAAKKQAVAETEKRTLFPKAQSALKSLEMNSQLVLDAIDKADKDIGWNTTGVAGALLKNWPASDAYDLRQTIDTIRANIGFAELAQMRENSPTGGALGAVSENENRLLQAVKGSLDPNQSSEQLRENLATIRKNYEAVLAERRKAFRQDYGGMLPKEEEETPPPKAERDPETPPEGVTIDEWKFMTQEERALFK